MEKKAVSIRDIDAKAWNRFRAKCLGEGVTVTAKINQMIREEVEKD
jgi:hypothetical protein